MYDERRKTSLLGSCDGKRCRISLVIQGRWIERGVMDGEEERI